MLTLFTPFKLFWLLLSYNCRARFPIAPCATHLQRSSRNVHSSRLIELHLHCSPGSLRASRRPNTCSQLSGAPSLGKLQGNPTETQKESYRCVQCLARKPSLICCIGTWWSLSSAARLTQGRPHTLSKVLHRRALAPNASRAFVGFVQSLK